MARHSVVGADELEFQIEGLSGPERELPDKRMHELFEERAERHPDAIAARCRGDAWTYAQLNENANRIAHSLIENGVTTETVVAVVTERNLGWMASVLGVFKAGGVYLPIEPHFPPGRIERTLARAGCTLIVTERGSTETLTEALSSLPPSRQLYVEDMLASSAAVTNPNIAVGLHQLAYIYFTSGSTGEPKGAMCEHAGMINHLYAKIDDFGIGEGEIVAQIAPQCFDISLWQLVSSLLVGGSTLIVDQDTIMQPDRFAELIVEAKVGVMQVVPSYLEVLLTYLEQHPVELSDLHCVSVTGEALSLELAHRFFRSLDGIKLANAYGLTETSDDTNHEVMTEAPYGTVPLGPSVNNVYVYVVDEFLAPVPLGAPGEIVFSGICVGRGYINDPDRTAQAYLADPIRPGERLYRSGDFGRWRPDGKLEYLGRRDAQVKIRGFRIEIGEIENTLLTRDGVRQAAVVVTDKSDGEQHLVAFHSGAHCSAADLQDHLGRSLPEYMVPTVFHWMESLPLTDNGKINKKALRALAAELDSPVDDYEPLSTDTERRLAEIWSGILAVPVDEIGRRDNFFDRGGSSLSAVELVVALDGAVTLKDVTGTPVLADLACVLDGDEATSDSLLQRLSDSDDGRNGVLVCMPYAGGNAINFRALAQALSGSGLAVHAVELPGHDMGENDDDFVPLGEVADRVAAEVAALSERPVALWGHSAGTALALEVARRLGNKGVELAAVFVAAQMPGDVALRRSFLDDLSAMSDRKMATSLLEATGYAEIEHLDAGQLGQLGAAYRHDVSNASRFFINELESSAVEPMATPLIVVSAAGDDATADASSRLGEWERFAETVRLIQLERGGHFFIRTEPSLAAGVVRQVMLGEDVAAEASEPESGHTSAARVGAEGAEAEPFEVSLGEGRPPLVVVDDKQPADRWVAAHQAALRSAITEHGAVLVRGLTINGPDLFAAAARCIADELARDTEAFAERIEHSPRIYSSSQWPANQQMCMHHELSYVHRFPSKIIFGCLQAGESGGAISLARSSEVLGHLPGDLVERFERHGWMLCRCYSEDIGLSVGEAFGTDDRAAIMRYCRDNAIDHEWRPDGSLITRQRRDAVIKHPVTGERSWFNQIAFLNEWTMKPEVRQFLIDTYGEDGLPFTTRFGNGDPIGPDVVETINAAYDRCAISEPLRTNDLLFVDNIAMAHSRDPYTGNRQVVVALADPV